MRTRTWCVAAALVCQPTLAAAQTAFRKPTRWRDSALKPARAGDSRGVEVDARGGARRRPLAQPAIHFQS